MELIVDDREHAVIQYLDAYPWAYVERIEHGDYCGLINGRIVFCIERKTWKDLANSIKDGRTRNLNKMLGLREKTGCALFYLIEGRPFYAHDYKICGIEFKSLLAHLDHCLFKHQIASIYAKDITDVLPRIACLLANCNACLPAEAAQADQSGLLKEKRQKTDRDILVDLWCAVPAVSVKTAAILLDHDLSLPKIVSMEEAAAADLIAALKRGEGVSIGCRTASKIVGNVHASSEAILMALQGISKKKARHILQQYTVLDIAEGAATAQDIGDIKYGGRRLGMKIGARIHRYLCHKSELFVQRPAAADVEVAAVDGAEDDDDQGEEEKEDGDEL